MKETYSSRIYLTMKFSKMILLLSIFAVLILIVCLVSCSSSGSGSPAQPSAVTITPPQQITADPGNNRVTLNWTPVTDAASFNIYYSTTAGVTKTVFDTPRICFSRTYPTLGRMFSFAIKVPPRKTKGLENCPPGNLQGLIIRRNFPGQAPNLSPSWASYNTTS